MKKYFLLFTVLLMAVSSSSYGMEPQFDEEQMERMRLSTHKVLSQKLASLSDQQLLELVEKATPLGEREGTTLSLEMSGHPLFVKKILLTDLEKKPENFRSTANLFGLPLYYQYGVGSTGFGAWRELEAHIMSTNWVLAGECPNFPIMYHWRVLDRPTPEPLTPEDLKNLEERVEAWNGSSAIRSRLELIQQSSSELVLFMEYIPETLVKWINAQFSKGTDALESALTMTERDLTKTTAFMRSHGFLHFDAHFQNILTDGSRLYFTDFGLAISSNFNLSEDERQFFQIHRDYDQYYTEEALVDQIGAHFFDQNIERKLHEYAAGNGGELESSLAIQILKRGAQNWIVMGGFKRTLRRDKTKTTPYPAKELKNIHSTFGL